MMLYLKRQVYPFVILFEGRTGSTFLTEHLDSHPYIRAHMEILSPYKNDVPIAQLRKAREILTPSIISRHKAVGFKTKLRIITDPSAFADLLHELNVRIIYLQRRNPIKVVLSAINSNLLKKQINDFNVYSKGQKMGALKIDIKKFDRKLKEREELDSKLEHYVNSLDLPILPLFYEDLIRDQDKELRRISDFLNVQYKKTEAKVLKHTKDDLHEAILNFEEVKSYYSGTKYERMFDPNFS